MLTRQYITSNPGELTHANADMELNEQRSTTQPPMHTTAKANISYTMTAPVENPTQLIQVTYTQ